MRAQGVISPALAAEPAPHAQVLEACGRCLQRERRLAPLTVTGTVGVVGRVLTAPAGLPLSALTVKHVHELVASEASRLSIGATWTSLSALRVFLRFLFATGRTPVTWR